MLKSDPGTYALILQSDSNETIQIGRWGQLDMQPGHYIYVGSAFGPGGVQARVSRHMRTDKQKHWHIDYLRKNVIPVEVWISYAAEHLEHEWADILFEMPELQPIQGFGCSDCGCYSHLFFTLRMPESNQLGRVERMPV
jgi:Uri superfamily endonuclease